MLERVARIERHETVAVAWSFAYFFCLLCGYYVVRPLRDEMGVAGGVEHLHWLFTGTFVAMLCAVPLFGLAVRRLPRRRLLPGVYGFFILNILAFFVAFRIAEDRAVLARVFFIWTSVFNLFVVSVFWSFMADLFSNAQARRLFGLIAAGGSAGAITGPALTAVLATRLGPVNLLPISALALGLAVLCILRLSAWARGDGGVARSGEARPMARGGPGLGNDAIGGGALAGIRLVFGSRYLLGIGAFIVLFTTLSTFLYFAQARIVADAFTDPGERTTLFAIIDLSVNVLTVSMQLFVTGRLIVRAGVGVSLALIPGLTATGFAGLAIAPILPVLVAFQSVRRAGGYAIMSPAREVLFTVIDRESKYKAKSVIDTVINRGGDAASAWLFAGLTAAGLGLSAIALIALPIALAWLALALTLGRWQERLRGAN